jgi:hypothetical protein
MPATPPEVSGHYFHFSTVILTNLVIGLFVCMCQAWNVTILQQEKHNHTSMTIESVVFALHFATIAFVDALCWNIFSVFGLVSKFDKALISQETDAILATLLVLLPSCLNPALLLLNRVQERRRREKEARFLTILRHKKNAER